MIPSAIIAKSTATQRMLLCASRAQRSPRRKPAWIKNVRAAPTKARSSPPVAATRRPSRTSCNTGRLAAWLNWPNMFSRKFKIGRSGHFAFELPSARAVDEPIDRKNDRLSQQVDDSGKAGAFRATSPAKAFFCAHTFFREFGAQDLLLLTRRGSQPACAGRG